MSIATPSDQNVARTPIGQRLKSQTKRRTKNSSAIRKRPRDARKTREALRRLPAREGQERGRSREEAEAGRAEVGETSA